MTLVPMLLSAFFLSPVRGSELKPVELSADARADWLSQAATAEVCVADELPPENVRAAWRHLGVKLFKRIAWDPECTAEYVRRKAGFLAVREEADGVWLVGEENFSVAWEAAIAEAETDVRVAQYCQSLARQALELKERDHKVWIEGRRVLGAFRFMDFDTENLDTLRLELVCCAKRLEQLLGVPKKDLPTSVPKRPEETGGVTKPLVGRSPKPVAVSLQGERPVKLSEAVSFSCGARDFCLTVTSSAETDGGTDCTGSLELYVPDGRGAYLPYEFRIDLSPVCSNCAPRDAYGLWQLTDRWGRDPSGGGRHTWRLRPVPRASSGSKYPHLDPRFEFSRNVGRPGWTFKLTFHWFALYGYWPAVRNGVSDRWYVSLDALPGVPAAAWRLDWERGREANVRRFGEGLSADTVAALYRVQREKAKAYCRWQEERLYGFARTAEPTFQRGDPESDALFWERMVEPMLEANKAVKPTAWNSLGRLFWLGERVSLARRDYLQMRIAGKTPPVPQAASGGERKIELKLEGEEEL